MKNESHFSLDGIHIKDKDGRVVLLRGCNLGGDSKIPFSPAGNPLLYDVSFTGRPFPEAEADEHFSRLAHWGFTFLRLVITWEAVEHAGPGVYDEDFLAYLRSILKKAEAHKIHVFIDPHQDVWSRWTGGDGAPYWTLEAAGFNVAHITETGSAFTHESQDRAYKSMSWGLNYLWYAAATMNTLFFAGNTFAPSRMVDGVPIQDYLQGHFIAAMKHTARRLKDCKAVAGFGTLNEPHCGFIGLHTIQSHHLIKTPEGSVPTAFQAMAASSGYRQAIRRFSLVGKITKRGKYVLNDKCISLFRDGYECPWREAGVWTVDNGVPTIRKSDHFARNSHGAPVDFCEDFLKPFQKAFMEAVSVKHEHYLFFVEGLPMTSRVVWSEADRIRSDGTRFSIVEAFHWYDGLTLIFRKWRPWLTANSETSTLIFGVGAVRRSIESQIKRLAALPRKENIPAFLGEFGVPFDLNEGKSFLSGDYSAQENALSAYYDGIDAALLPSTIWNYSASNTHEMGDRWNLENLSIYSASTGEGRAVRGFSRPYAMAIAGIPVAMHFKRKNRVFTLEWNAVEGVTEIFVPSIWYPEGWRAEFIGGNAIVEEKPEDQRLFVEVSGGGSARIRIHPLK
jgi:hypothetical protein